MAAVGVEAERGRVLARQRDELVAEQLPMLRHARPCSPSRP